MKKIKQYYKYLIYFPILIIILDQLTKFLIMHYMQFQQSISIIPKIFHLTYITNSGTFFGLMQGGNSNSLFIWLTIIILGAILYFYDQFNKTEKIVFSLIIGAAIGNLIDRIVHGHVIDFIDFRIWPVFNVADIVISVSVVFLMVYIFIKKGK